MEASTVSCMKFAQVVLDIPTQALEGSYVYAAHSDLGDIEVGSPVLVPFGGRSAVGFVMKMRSLDELAPEAVEEALGCDSHKVKPITRLLGRSLFPRESAACAQFLAQHYIAPLASCVRLFTPPGGVPRMVHGRDGWYLRDASVGKVDDRWVRLAVGAREFHPRKQAVKQRAIIAALDAGELRVADLRAEYGSVSATLRSLATKGVIEIFSRRRMRGTSVSNTPTSGCDYGLCTLDAAHKPYLTPGQQRAVAAISKAFQAHSGQVVLVDGVTGSGKTEVYLRAIEEVVRSGRSAIVLVPEISLTPQTVARFRGRFGDMVAVLHSRMGTGERFDQWDFIRSGEARVIVGARSALFAPVADLGLIVIDEEHEASYKQDSAPRYVTRDVAAWMARERGAALVLGSATPSIEALFRVQHDPTWTAVELPERANGKPLPSIEVVDMAHEFSAGSRSMFSHRLQQALRETLTAGNKAVLMLNQRGFAQFVLCRACGFVPQCPSCSTSLTFHEKGNVLMCHHCGFHMTTPAVCPQCGSPYLKRFGAGTQRVEAELASILAGFSDVDAHIVRMDADTTARKGAHQKLLEEFAAADAAVLLGTQMIAKGLDFDDVTLVGVINADTQLRLPDFRSAERTFDLIEQVAGRSGRAQLPGRVIVQTYSATSIAIQAAAHYDRTSWLNHELESRKSLGYPPFVRLADVLVWGRDEAAVRREAGELYRRMTDAIDEHTQGDWTILAPTPCVLSRLRGSWRYHITVKAPATADIARVLTPVFRSRRAVHELSVAVDIDPASML